MTWKYIIVRTSNRETPVIFPESLNHCDMFEAMKDYYGRIALVMSNGVLSMKSVIALRNAVEIASAGFINLETGEAHGKSESLNVESRPEDTNFIRSYQYHQGIR